MYMKGPLDPQTFRQAIFDSLGKEGCEAVVDDVTESCCV